jgi:uncharacterized protein involved in exopolysaccharide biosynthesis
MTEESPPYLAAPAPVAETSLLEIVNGILRHWRLVVLLPLAMAVTVGTLKLTSKRSYNARASFVPQTTEKSSISGAAALAQQFGVSLGGDRGGQSPQFYEELLRSVTILRRAVESTYDLPATDKAPARRGTLIDHWRLAEKPGPLPPWRSAIERLRSAVGTSVRRETGVIDLTVTVDHAGLAEQVSARLLELLNEYNLEVRKTRARDEAKFVRERLADVQGDLRAAENALEAFIRNNRDIRNSPDLTFQRDRLERQVSARQEVYTTLLRAQEQAQVEGMRDTPVLQIIDAPAGSGLPASRKVLLNAVIAFLFGLLVAIGFATTRELARRDRLSGDTQYQEFERLWRTLWREIRSPALWFRRGSTT